MVILLIILLIALFYWAGRRYGWIEKPGDSASSPSLAAGPYRYHLVPGFFAHDRPSRIPGRAFPDTDGYDDNNEDAAAAAAAGAAEPPPPLTASFPSLGLIYPYPPPSPFPNSLSGSSSSLASQPITQWSALMAHLALLNGHDGSDAGWAEATAPLLHNNRNNPYHPGPIQSKYKLVYLVRAGPSHHSEKEEEVGRREWETHWSRLDGDVARTWADAGLTDDGAGLVEWVGGVLGWRKEDEEPRRDGFMTPVAEEEVEVEEDGDGDGSETMVGDENEEQEEESGRVRRRARAGVMGIGMPPKPGKIYTSPLCRALETTRAMFGGVSGDSGSKDGHLSRPSSRAGSDDNKTSPSMIIKEYLRERHGRKTCDRRSGKSRIASSFPGQFEFEPDFAEGDVLWKPDARESRAMVEARARSILDDVFFGEREPNGESEDSTVVCLTTHAGVIRALCKILGRRPPLWIAPGQVVPVVIRAEQVAPMSDRDRDGDRNREWDLEAARGF